MSPNNEYELPDEALRLVLTYRRHAPPGQEVTLDEIQRVEMRLSASDELPEHEPDEPLSGFWYELQSHHGEVLYRQIIGNPIRTSVYLPDEEDPTRLVRLETLPEEKTFVLLVPAFPEAAEVVLHSSSLDEPSISAPAEPMWRIPLPRREEG